MNDDYIDRRRTWLAITLATVVQVFSYFAFAAAFARPVEEGVDGGLVAIAMAVAPFVFVILALVSQNPAPRRVMGAMGLLLLLGFTIGLASPVLGAAAGFGAGGILTLKDPGYRGAMKARVIAVTLAVLYTFALLVVITPAGVFTGALLPLIAIGFADEYSGWRAAKVDHEAASSDNTESPEANSSS